MGDGLPSPNPQKGSKSTMSRMILKAANALVNLVVVLCLCLAGTYAGYALWDNSRVYTAASDVQADMVKIKPAVQEDGGASFEELLAINPDVRAWVTLDNTKIDHPVLQGATNLTYINRDVYGNFALAGSIYLDTRNDPSFADAYSLLYGHHMENSGMFGDLDLYKNETFFNENSTGTLILPEKTYKLEIFACLLLEAGEDAIFNPEQWQTDIGGLLAFARERSLFTREAAIRKLEEMPQPKVLAFSTCASEFTDARTIVLAVMEPYETLDQEDSEL